MYIQKTHTTMKRFNSSNSIAVSYCGAWHLLYGLSPIHYNAGVYGWNCDIYDAGAAYIVTGYRNTRGRHNYETTAAFEARAKAIYDDRETPYDEMCAAIASLRSEWVAAVMAD